MLVRTKKTVIVLSDSAELGNIISSRLKELSGITVFDYGYKDPVKYVASKFAGWDGNDAEFLDKVYNLFKEYDDNIWMKHLLNQLDRQSGLLPFNFAVVTSWSPNSDLLYLAGNPILEVMIVNKEQEIEDIMSEISKQYIVE